VTRVEWARTEPGDIEHVVAMLLCRENPSAVRIRPSQGDGGIDVLAPSRDGAGVAVYQVKSFTRNLTHGQKAQAERSGRRLLDYAEGRGLHVVEWYLTLPLCPTNENLEWLSGFTSGHGLTAE
jgi:Restriction endonuclease